MMIIDIIKLLINPPKISKDIYITEEGAFGLKSRPLKERYLKLIEESKIDKIKLKTEK